MTYVHTFCSFLKTHKKTILIILGILTVVGVTEYVMGRSPLGPDGHFGFWDGNIWSSENSQRVADPYTFSHLGHGLIFYFLFWLFGRKLPLRYRLIFSVLLEASWEILENSPLIINRYREATIAVGYVGDSILNSLSDIIFMAIGFMFARHAKAWVSLALLIAMELGCAYWVRDNLTLNVVMLVHPIPAIQQWQSEGQH